MLQTYKKQELRAEWDSVAEIRLPRLSFLIIYFFIIKVQRGQKKKKRGLMVYLMWFSFDESFFIVHQYAENTASMSLWDFSAGFIYLFIFYPGKFVWCQWIVLKRKPRSDPTQYQLNFILNGIKWCSIDCLNEYGNDTAAKFLNQWGTID